MSIIRKNIQNNSNNENISSKTKGISSLSSINDKSYIIDKGDDSQLENHEYASISTRSSSRVSGGRSSESTPGKLPQILIGLLFLLLLGIGGFYFVLARSGSGILSPLSSENKTGSKSGLDNNVNQNMSYENPINGMRFSDDDAAKFKDQKPIAVMVNNYVEARPSFGLSQADIVYEVVAESGITRLMPIFYSRLPEKVESIRSLRYYFAELAAPYHPHMVRWGAAFVPACQKAAPGSSGYCLPVGGKVETDPSVDAYDRVVKLGLPNLDGGNYACDGSKCVFSRNQDRIGKVAIEHTAFVRLPKIYELAKQIRPEESWHKYTDFKKWNFKDDASASDRGDVGMAAPITYKYSDTMAGFDVKWNYNKEKNEYIRHQDGVKQIDALFNTELRAKVVIVRFTEQTPVGDKKNHLFHKITGSGKALVFQDGKVTDATWSRTTHEEMDVYKDAKGNLIEFTRGQIWVQVVPSENKVNYEPSASSVSPTATKVP